MSEPRPPWGPPPEPPHVDEPEPTTPPGPYPPGPYPPTWYPPGQYPPGWGPSPWGAPAPIPQDEYGFPLLGPGSRPPIWMRAIARIIDLLPMFAVFSIAALRWVHVGDNGSVNVEDVPLWLFPAVQLVDIVYETVTVALWGQTAGKWLMGLRVEDPQGARPGWRRAAVRVAIPDLAAMIPVLGGGLLTAAVYLSAVWSPLRQGLHDRAAGTIVVRSR